MSLEFRSLLKFTSTQEIEFSYPSGRYMMYVSVFTFKHGTDTILQYAEIENGGYILKTAPDMRIVLTDTAGNICRIPFSLPDDKISYLIWSTLNRSMTIVNEISTKNMLTIRGGIPSDLTFEIEDENGDVPHSGERILLYLRSDLPDFSIDPNTQLQIYHISEERTDKLHSGLVPINNNHVGMSLNCDPIVIQGTSSRLCVRMLYYVDRYNRYHFDLHASQVYIKLEPF